MSVGEQELLHTKKGGHVMTHNVLCPPTQKCRHK